MATTFRKVAVVGAGAVGSFYGAMLARAGHAVVLIGRPAHVAAIRRDGLRLEMAGRTETVAVNRVDVRPPADQDDRVAGTRQHRAVEAADRSGADDGDLAKRRCCHAAFSSVAKKILPPPGCTTL